MKNFNPLFIVGHKRSGSTHLMRLLNLHPKIFISNETDILWILYQLSKGNKPFQKHPFDGAMGMENCLEKYGDLLGSDKSPFENFILSLIHI